MKTNAETVRWTRRYQAALRKQCSSGPDSNLRVTAGLGRQAVALGLETLDIRQSSFLEKGAVNTSIFSGTIRMPSEKSSAVHNSCRAIRPLTASKPS